MVRRATGGIIEIRPETTEAVRLASLSFVLANGDRHGFKLCPDAKDVRVCKAELEKAPNWPDAKSGEDLTDFVRSKLRDAANGQGLRFVADGRLCDSGTKDCLIDRWQTEK